MDHSKAQQVIDEAGAQFRALTVQPEDVLEYREEALGWKGGSTCVLKRGETETRIRGGLHPNLIMDLRNAMASPDTGSWFKCVIRVTFEGEVSCEFDYDSKPDFDPLPILDKDIIDELTNWPRSDEHIPQWLRELMIERGIENPPSV